METKMSNERNRSKKDTKETKTWIGQLQKLLPLQVQVLHVIVLQKEEGDSPSQHQQKGLQC